MSAHLAPLRAASCLHSLEVVSEGSPRARRNLLVGLWAGRRLGLGEDELAIYCKSVMECDHEEPGDEDVLRKLAADLAAAGRPTPLAELRLALVSAQRRAYSETLHHD